MQTLEFGLGATTPNHPAVGGVRDQQTEQYRRNYLSACCVARRVGLPIHPFLLERSKETLDGGVGSAVATLLLSINVRPADDDDGNLPLNQVVANILATQDALFFRA